MTNRLQEPLRFERIFLEKVWGGSTLAAPPDQGGLSLDLPPGKRIGETWELVDRPDANSVVADGNLCGATLHELLVDLPGDLLGRLQPTPEGRFPLLVKFIDAAEHLSVQVHPDEPRARRHPAWEAKSEAWAILGSREAGRIYHGFAPGVTRDSFARAIEQGEPLEGYLRSFRPTRGQCFFVPGGTVHAIGAGVTLVEVQENSDTTFRVDDWGRVGLDGEPRELHVEAALECLDFGPAPDPVQSPDPAERPFEMVRCPAFSMATVDVAAPLDGDTAGVNPAVLAAVRGAGQLTSASGSFTLGLGDVCLLPAALGSYTIQSTGPAPLRLISMRGPEPHSH